MKTLDICPLQIGGGSVHAIQLPIWAQILQILYDLRNVKNIQEQIRRLRLRSHEKIDTILVFLVAGRYHRRDFGITFEPNGRASSDLLVRHDSYRIYIEVKRENRQEHNRQRRMQSLGGEISDRVATHLKQWLKQNELRIEIKLSKLFGDGHVGQVVQEVEAKVKAASVGTEEPLASVTGSKMLLLSRSEAFHYAKGFHTGVVRIEKPGAPVPAFAPTSMPVRCTFDSHPNLDALGQRIREAGRQLSKDLNNDIRADGLVVLECSGGNEACGAVQKRFWSRLPPRCLGVTLISNPGFVIPRSDLKTKQMELLEIAGID